ncbi:MAG: serine/threonine protein kinase [Deltaproteobacteria bacterium]|nr:serine/threonine protein kinase [Deltaproteobacteria bacterium]
MSQLIFDKYEMIKRLAVGGMGEIFLARQKGVAGFDRLVIIKTLLPDLAEQEGFIDQFLDEARVAATLNHPNIVYIHEVGLWEGVHFIAMEYINGESISRLRSAARKLNTTIPVPIAVRIVHDAALGLDYAHHAADPDGRPLGIVHRDVTPHNIMVRTDGVTKVVDFGVALANNRASRTATGTIKGKIPYMPPEQLSCGELDGRTDQWALGVVLWELLTSKRLFKSDTEVAAIQSILHDRIPAPSTINPRISGELDDIVMRMLQRPMKARYPRLSEVAEALRTYLESVSRLSTEAEVAKFVLQVAGSGIEERTSNLTPASENYLISLRSPGSESRSSADIPIALPARSRRRRRQLLAVGLSMGLLVGVGALLLLRPWEPPPELSISPDPGPPSRPEPIPEPPRHDPVPAAEPATVLRLTSEPSEARVYSGERLLGQTPLRISTLSPATDHQLVVEKPGFEPSIVQLRLEDGEIKDLAVTLTRKVKRPAPSIVPGPTPKPGPAFVTPSASREDGYLTLKTKPWTQVSIGGTPYGTTPVFKIKLPPGRHTVSLVNEAAAINETRVVEIRPGAITKEDFVLR